LRPRVRLLLPALLIAVGGLLALSPLASADIFSPESGASPNADAIDSLYWLLFALSVVVFLGVEGALIWCLFKFRARRGAIPAQIRGNTRLEIGWTIGAALILVVIAVVTFAQLDDIRDAPPTDQAAGLQLPARPSPAETDTPDDKAFPANGRSLRIVVDGQQYVWRYQYPRSAKEVYSYVDMVVPVGMTVTLEITSQDVAHSWWIPELGGKFDAIPGHTNYTWLKVPGRLAGRQFRGQCAELCGRNHANMIAYVVALKPRDYQAYIERRRREITDANRQAAEQRRQIEGNR